MEPLSTSILGSIVTLKFFDWVFGTHIGNHSDRVFCRLEKELWNSIASTFGTPPNHDIQRSVRKAMLKSVIVSCDHFLEINELSSKATKTIRQIIAYAKQSGSTTELKKWIPKNPLDENFEIFMIPKDKLAIERLDDLVVDMTNRFLRELELQKLFPVNTFSNHLINGWNYKGRKVTWLDLMAAFFHEEIKVEPRLTNFIQTKILFGLQSEFQTTWEEVESHLKLLSDNNSEIISKLDNIEETVSKIDTQLSHNTEITKQIHEKTTQILEGAIAALPRELALPPINPEVFIGRSSQVEELHSLFFKKSIGIVALSGEGGIGKTTIASAYYHKFKSSYTHLIWIFCENSVSNSIVKLAAALGIRFDAQENNEEQVEIVFKALVNLDTPSLLVLDNVDDRNLSDEEYALLRRCSNLDILITSRMRELHQVAVQLVQGISNAESIELFKKYYPQVSSQDEEIILEIKKSVDSNTLVLELLAKNLNRINTIEESYAPSQLLKDLQSRGLFQLQQVKKVESDYFLYRRANPLDVISAMYDMAELSQDELSILDSLSVLPAEAIPVEPYLARLFKGVAEYDETIIGLYQKGFLDFNRETKTIRINQIVQEISLSKSDLWLEECIKIARRLQKVLDLDWISNHDLNDYELYIRFAESLIHRGSNETVEKSLELLFELQNLSDLVGRYYHLVGGGQKGIDNLENLVALNELFTEAHPNLISYKEVLAKSYIGLASKLKNLGEISTSLKNYKRAHVVCIGLIKEVNLSAHGILILEVVSKELIDLYRQENKPKLAERHLTEEIDQLKSFLGEMYKWSTDFTLSKADRHTLGNAQKYLAKLFSLVERTKESLLMLHKAHAELKELVSESAKVKDYRKHLAETCRLLAENYIKIEEYQKSIELFGEEIDHYETLRKKTNVDHKDDISVKEWLVIAHQGISNAQFAVRDYDAALQSLETAIKLSEEFMVSYPDHQLFMSRRASCFATAGVMFLHLGKQMKGEEYTLVAILYWKELAKVAHDQLSNQNQLKNAYKILNYVNLEERRAFNVGALHLIAGEMDQAKYFMDIASGEGMREGSYWLAQILLDEMNTGEAIEHLKRAALNGHQIALNHLIRIDLARFTRFRKDFRLCTNSLITYGEMLCMIKEEEKGIDYLEWAVGHKVKPAMVALSKIYEKRDHDKYLHYLKMAAHHGDEKSFQKFIEISLSEFADYEDEQLDEAIDLCDSPAWKNDVNAKILLASLFLTKNANKERAWSIINEVITEESPIQQRFSKLTYACWTGQKKWYDENKERLIIELIENETPELVQLLYALLYFDQSDFFISLIERITPLKPLKDNPGLQVFYYVAIQLYNKDDERITNLDTETELQCLELISLVTEARDYYNQETDNKVD